jgi:hypothetical protein
MIPGPSFWESSSLWAMWPLLYCHPNRRTAASSPTEAPCGWKPNDFTVGYLSISSWLPGETLPWAWFESSKSWIRPSEQEREVHPLVTWPRQAPLASQEYFRNWQEFFLPKSVPEISLRLLTVVILKQTRIDCFLTPASESHLWDCESFLLLGEKYQLLTLSLSPGL